MSQEKGPARRSHLEGADHHQEGKEKEVKKRQSLWETYESFLNKIAPNQTMDLQTGGDFKSVLREFMVNKLASIFEKNELKLRQGVADYFEANPTP